jgi:hypothetical protein
MMSSIICRLLRWQCAQQQQALAAARRPVWRSRRPQPAAGTSSCTLLYLCGHMLLVQSAISSGFSMLCVTWTSAPALQQWCWCWQAGWLCASLIGAFDSKLASNGMFSDCRLDRTAASTFAAGSSCSAAQAAAAAAAPSPATGSRGWPPTCAQVGLLFTEVENIEHGGVTLLNTAEPLCPFRFLL